MPFDFPLTPVVIVGVGIAMIVGGAVARRKAPVAGTALVILGSFAVLVPVLTIGLMGVVLPAFMS